MTLLVDLDSQANATEQLGIKLQPGVFSWLATDEVAAVERYFHGLDVIPGDATTERLNLIMASEGDMAALDRRLDELEHTYAYALLDCPPSMSMVTRAAIYAADYVLCPTLCEYLSVAGVRQLVVLMAQMRERLGRRVRLMGIVPNRYDRRTTEHRTNLRHLVRAYGAYGSEGAGRVWPPLSQAIAIARASSEGEPIWNALKGPVLEQWEALGRRVTAHG
jgi:chromosome partitioning protein